MSSWLKVCVEAVNAGGQFQVINRVGVALAASGCHNRACSNGGTHLPRAAAQQHGGTLAPRKDSCCTATESP